MDGTIKDFIKITVEEIQTGLPEGYEVSDEINFDISVITTTNKKGGLNIKIATGEIDKEKQTIHSIHFGVINPKKQQETMHTTAISIISYIKQGLTALSKIPPIPAKPESQIQEINNMARSKNKKKNR